MTIELIKIDSAEQYIEMQSASGTIDPEEMAIIERSQRYGLYEHTKSTPFGMFIIAREGRYVGGITLTPWQSSIDSNGMVDVEISYSTNEAYRGQGIMTEAIKLALEYIQNIKEHCQEIRFVECRDCTNPEKYEVLPAKAIGTVYANVTSISNYPSLSCSLKAGGEIAAVSSGIKVTFLNQDASPFSESFKLALTQCSKTLCQLGFNEYDYGDEADKYRMQIEAKKLDAQKALNILIAQTEDIPTRDDIIASWLSPPYGILGQALELSQDGSMTEQVPDTLVESVLAGVADE